MPGRSRGIYRILVLIAMAFVIVVGVVVVTVYTRRQRLSRNPPPTATHLSSDQASPTSTSPATRPTQSERPKYATTYMDVIRAEFPAIPTTQPLAFPLELNQAARLIIQDPLFLSKSSADLWITRPDAPPTKQVLKEISDPASADMQTHVLRERVAFVDWLTNQGDAAVPYLICKSGENSFELVSPGGRKALPNRRDYQWGRAFVWDDRVVVPSRTGISVIEIRPELKEFYRELLPGSTAAPATSPADEPELQPQALPDGEGLLAWVPWEHGRPGSRGAVRFLNGKWADLGPDQAWPEKIVHLVPLRDGTVFQFVSHDDGSISLETMSLQASSVDEAEIAKLVDKLSDPDPEERRKAVSAISNFGPGAWPVLTRLSANQPPQARMLLKQLLRDKTRPTLSGMTLLGNRLLQLAARLSDGGAVFYAPQGASVPSPNADDEPTVTAPAWLSVRPGHYVELLPAGLLPDLKPDNCHLDVVGDQWVATTDVRGPRLFFGNGFATLLRKDERTFSRVLGMDSRGRWLFRKPADDNQTLIIDPHLPDPVPRLPVWNLAIAQTVGWDKDNWPVIQNGSAYALTETDWRPLGTNEKFFTRADQVPPATLPTTAPASDPTDPLATGHPLLTMPDGTVYFGGLTDLTFIDPTGKHATWPLPPGANGTGPATLIAAKSGRLFLFNQPGRVLRLTRTPTGPEPFKLDATFTRNVPNAAHPTRIWLDPAGRIDLIDGSRLAVLFPDGYIPRAISEKMVDQNDLDADSQ